MKNIFLENAVVPEVPDKRPLAPIQIEADVNDALDAIFGKERRIKRSSVSDVLRWFVTQPVAVRRMILGVDEGLENAYAEVLESWARQLRAIGAAPKIVHKTGRLPSNRHSLELPEPRKPSQQVPKG